MWRQVEMVPGCNIYLTLKLKISYTDKTATSPIIQSSVSELISTKYWQKYIDFKLRPVASC